MIFELATNFHNAVAAIPREHPKHRMLELLREAIRLREDATPRHVRRDIHFIARHPTTLFQCMPAAPEPPGGGGWNGTNAEIGLRIAEYRKQTRRAA